MLLLNGKIEWNCMVNVISINYRIVYKNQVIEFMSKFFGKMIAFIY